MGIGKKSDGKFYIRCDWHDCSHQEDLDANNFWEASDEARKKGWLLAKDKHGRWVNFHTRFCETCYNAPQVIVHIPKSDK